MGEIIDKNSLNNIMKNYIADYCRVESDKEIKPYIHEYVNIPIIWFGDLNAYDSSKIKIVTVALNPSDREFTELRFDKTINIHRDFDLIKNRLINTLNQYFEYNPYEWFRNGFEWALNAMNASYFQESGGFSYRAIHIDIYSAVATRVKWTKIPTKIREKMQNVELFKELLAFLEPDIIISCCDKNGFGSSFNHDLFAKEVGASSCEWIWDYEYNYQNGCYKKNVDKNRIGSMNQYIRVFHNDSNKILIWGKTRNLPFGGMKRIDNPEFTGIFKEIVQRIDDCDK